MQLSELKLRNFRNYQKADVHFSDGVNVFLGANAQGKTNLLEAIYMLALTKSHRTNNDRDLINWNQTNAQIAGVVTKDQRKTDLEIKLGKRGKSALINHLEQPKLSSFIGELNVILFAPEDLKLVKGAPATRRRFMDMEFGQMSSQYLYNTTQFHRILRQRNAYLKKIAAHKQKDFVYLDVLSDQLSAYAAKIIYQRLVLLKRLQKWSRKIHNEISQGSETLTFQYNTSLKSTQLTDVNSIYKGLLAKFKDNREKEIKLRTTIFGPHRDDLKFLVNGKDVSQFGSQGQQRTTALATKLAEIDLMKEETGQYPVLLLDDVLSELDEDRQTHLLLAIQDKVQTFITTTSTSGVSKDLVKNPRVFNISDGKVVRK